MSIEFIGSNLRLARLFNDLSLQELGESVGLSKQFLSRLEAGVGDRPTATLEDILANQLGVFPEFFRFVDPMPITDEQCHFRKQLTTKVSLRQFARAKGEMLKRLVSILDSELDLPTYKFKESEPAENETIELAAERARIDWGLGFGPIANMVRVADTAGAVVLRMNDMAAEIDAISFATRRPVIALNATGRSACRERFGIAHEIGHLSLHIGIQTGDRLTEQQANRFASAFLMPRTVFIGECQRAIRGSRFLNWTTLAEIKLRWGVSKAAILYRGRQLGVFSEDQYKSGVINLNRHGEARGEVEDSQIAFEEPEVLLDGLRVLDIACGMPQAAIGRIMNVQPRIIDSLLEAAIPKRLPASGNVVNLFGRFDYDEKHTPEGLTH
jgi:Zn-dependent peptidase ImmA (M78 family)